MISIARILPPPTSRPYLLLVVPVLLFLAIFFAWPVGQIIVLSFTEPTLGLGNYAALVTESSLHRLMWRTVRISLITAALSVLFGYIIAYAMLHVRDRVFTLMLSCVLLPFWLSVIVQAFSWIMLLRSNGLVNGLLQGIGTLQSPLPMMRNEFGVLVGMAHFMTPVAIMILIGNLKAADRRLVLAANSLGASWWQAFRMVFLPQSLPGIYSAFTVVFIVALGFYITPALLGGGKTVMAAEYISVQVLQVARWGIPAMLSTVMLAAVAALLFGISRFVDLKRSMFASG